MYFKQAALFLPLITTAAAWPLSSSSQSEARKIARSDDVSWALPESVVVEQMVARNKEELEVRDKYSHTGIPSVKPTYFGDRPRSVKPETQQQKPKTENKQHAEPQKPKTENKQHAEPQKPKTQNKPHVEGKEPADKDAKKDKEPADKDAKKDKEPENKDEKKDKEPENKDEKKDKEPENKDHKQKPHGATAGAVSHPKKTRAILIGDDAIKAEAPEAADSTASSFPQKKIPTRLARRAARHGARSPKPEPALPAAISDLKPSDIAKLSPTELHDVLAAKLADLEKQAASAGNGAATPKRALQERGLSDIISGLKDILKNGIKQLPKVAMQWIKSLFTKGSAAAAPAAAAPAAAAGAAGAGAAAGAAGAGAAAGAAGAGDAAGAGAGAGAATGAESANQDAAAGDADASMPPTTQAPVKTAKRPTLAGRRLAARH